LRVESARCSIAIAFAVLLEVRGAPRSWVSRRFRQCAGWAQAGGKGRCGLSRNGRKWVGLYLGWRCWRGDE